MEKKDTKKEIMEEDEDSGTNHGPARSTKLNMNIITNNFHIFKTVFIAIFHN